MNEELEDLDDLPEISFDTSVTGVSLSFEMPDARTMAAQRRLESELDAEIKRTEEELAMEPEDSSANDLAIELAVLKRSIHDVTVPFENPGVDLRELSKMEIIDKLDGERALFLADFVDQLLDCKEPAIKTVLCWYLDSLERSIIEDTDGFEANDIHCNVVALALLSLDMRCRHMVNQSRVRNLMTGLLNQVGRRYQSVLHNDLLEHLLRIIPHFHNRLMLADYFHVANVEPNKLSDPEFFSCKLAIGITHSALCHMLGYGKRQLNERLTVKELKDLVLKGSKWHTFNHYEQYYCIVCIVNLLLRYTDIGTSESLNESDEAAFNEMIHFLANVKGNNNRSGGSFLKVKNLITVTKLLMQSKRGKDCGNVYEANLIKET